MINFKTIPFLKLLLPFIVGVFITVYFQELALHYWLIVSFVAMLVSYLAQRFHKSKHYFKKLIYIICANTFLMVLANKCCYLYQAKNETNHYSHYIESSKQNFFATIIDIPVQNKTHTKLSFSISGISQNNNWHYATGEIKAYLKGQHPTLKTGDVVFVNTKLSYLNEPQNPNEFDYKTFLEHKNIFHVTYLNPNDLTFVKTTTLSFSNIGTNIKSKIVSVLKNSGLSQDAFSICTALLVGYDDEITNNVVQQFSHSGTLHILSVSGLHTGVLYGLLIWLFSFFDKANRYKKTTSVIILITLWLFVSITGFCPAVLRAALMLSLILIGKTYNKQSNTYNALFLSAFILLLFNPYLLFDVGFQLSYLAVLGILYFYPILKRIYQFDNKYLQKLWDSVLISVAATLFTLPIALYNFHQFPVWFAFSNMLIIPISMGIMIGAVILIFVYKIGFIKTALVFLINKITLLMLFITNLTDNSNYGFIDSIHFSKLDFVFCSISIYLFLLFIYSRQFKHVILFLSVLIAWNCFGFYLHFVQKQTQELVVFHVKQKSAVVLKTKNSLYIIAPDLSDNELNRYVKPYLLDYYNVPIRNSKAKIFSNSTSQLVINPIGVSDSLILCSKYLILRNNTLISEEVLQKKKPTIIADCSNNYTFVKEMKKRCAKAGAAFYSIKESGAFKIKL